MELVGVKGHTCMCPEKPGVLLSSEGGALLSSVGPLQHSTPLPEGQSSNIRSLCICVCMTLYVHLYMYYNGVCVVLGICIVH